MGHNNAVFTDESANTLNKDTGDVAMAAYLVCSILTGFACAAVGYLGYGAGFGQIALWYVLGSWIGFGGGVAFFLVGEARHTPTIATWRERSGAR